MHDHPMITIEYLRNFKIGEYAIFDLTVSFLESGPLPTFIPSISANQTRYPPANWLFLTLPSDYFHLAGNNTHDKYFLDPSAHSSKFSHPIFRSLSHKIIKI
jgi:hypothetical protein